jgi:hypothetical protein
VILNLLFLLSTQMCIGNNTDMVVTCLRLLSKMVPIIVANCLSGLIYFGIVVKVFEDKFVLSRIFAVLALLSNIVIYKFKCKKFIIQDHSFANLIIFAIAFSVGVILYCFYTSFRIT